ncbi:AraC family transcriptional regulator [Flavobacterium ajazii]|uniref:AraC family transcriptional regulator n=1 Tax=Flavobacterium ajazii TaxID=2692318 RepID=UPI0013D05150|nr:AraC family transcriptional regulator [Flavobacterium ajazii]
MNNYFKYLPVNKDFSSWGINVLNAGYGKINAEVDYPSQEHPSDHYFSWETGRILDEFQVVYISSGCGLFESASAGTVKIEAGSILFLFPYEWHRFKPVEGTGWEEYWIGFNGKLARRLLKKSFLSKENPILNVGFQEQIQSLYIEIIEQIKNEFTGYQPQVSGALLHLIGTIYSLNKQKSIRLNSKDNDLMKEAVQKIRNHIYSSVSITELSSEMNMGYSSFRKSFKQYTGLAPNQYLLQLKIDKAKLMLSTTKKTVKEITFELGFESASYFSKIFKTKTGVSPERFRKSTYTGN